METFPWSFLLSINNCGLSCGSMLKPELAGRQLPGKVIGRAGTGLPSYPQQGYRDTGASPGGDNGRLNTSGLGVCAGMDGRFGSVVLPVLAHTHAHIPMSKCAPCERVGLGWLCILCATTTHPSCAALCGTPEPSVGAEPHVCLPGESPAPCVLSLQDPLGVCFLPDSLPGAVLHPPHHILHQPWVGAPRPARLLSGSPMGPAQQGWGASSSRSVPQGGSVGCRCWWPGCHLPSSPGGHSLQQHHGVLRFSPCNDQRGCGSPHPPGDNAAHSAFIFKALPASSFILTPPQRLGGLCYRLSISQLRGCSQALGCFAGAGVGQSPAARLARCWGGAEGNPAAGLCRDLPGANPPPAVSAGPRAGTAWHHMAQHGTAPRLCNTHRDAMPVVLLSLAGKRLLGACPSSSLTTSEQSNTHSIQSTEI